MRNLATVQEVLSIEEIPGAEKVELVRFKDSDFVAVCNKNLHTVGSQVVMFEADSILENVAGMEWMEPFGFRVKMIRMAGVISQVVLAPISILPAGNYTNDQDVTDLLGVTKWEASSEEVPNPKIGDWPYAYATKTDETRLQSMKELTDKVHQLHPNLLLQVDEKLEGQSSTWLMLQNEQVLHAASRNFIVEVKPNDAFDRAAKYHNLEDCMKKFLNTEPTINSITLQGELVGPGVANNYYKLADNKVFVFNITIKYKDGSEEKIPAGKRQSWLDKNLPESKLKTPGTYEKISITQVKDLSEKVNTLKSLLNPELWAEGVVVRPVNQDIYIVYKGLQDSRLSFKIISDNYENLVKNAKHNKAPKEPKEPKPIPEWALAKKAEAEARRQAKLQEEQS